MRNRIFLVLILIAWLNEVCAQTIPLDDFTSKFKAECLENLVTDVPLYEFELKQFKARRKSTTLRFSITANCAFQNRGNIVTSGDTLIITETDIRTIERKVEYQTDSLGRELEVTSETQVSEIVFCDCRVHFFYRFSKSLKGIRFLRFHDHTFTIQDFK